MLPEWVSHLVSDGRIALLGLAVIALEAVLIVLFVRRRGRVIPLALTLAAGAGLLFALHAALSGASAVIITAGLLLALFAHAADMVSRLYGKT